MDKLRENYEDGFLILGAWNQRCNGRLPTFLWKEEGGLSLIAQVPPSIAWHCKAKCWGYLKVLESKVSVRTILAIAFAAALSGCRTPTPEPPAEASEEVVASDWKLENARPTAEEIVRRRNSPQYWRRNAIEQLSIDTQIVLVSPKSDRPKPLQQGIGAGHRKVGGAF